MDAIQMKKEINDMLLETAKQLMERNLAVLGFVPGDADVEQVRRDVSTVIRILNNVER